MRSLPSAPAPGAPTDLLGRAPALFGVVVRGDGRGRQLGFATANLWVTRYDPDELYAAGRYPSQSTGGDGLPAFVAQDRTIEGTDIVVWHTFGVTHLVRPEDFPVMPVEMTGFTLVPYGFFDRNPAMDVPPTDAHGTGSHCHTDDAPTCH